MKRKLINYDVFERIQKDSMSNAEYELVEASLILAKAIGADSLTLRCFGPENALYEHTDGSFVHTSYRIKDNTVCFENIEQLVIDEDSEKAKSRGVLKNMLEALLENNDKVAEDLFSEYLSLPTVRRIFCEAKQRRVVPIRDSKGNIKGYKPGMWNTKPKKSESPSDTLKRIAGKKKKKKVRPQSQQNLLKMKRKAIARQIGEWHALCENVVDYLVIKEFGPSLKESHIQSDERGNIVNVEIPTTRARNEAKLLSFNWKTLNTDVKVLRGNAKKLNEDVNFAKAVIELKRQNALSDNDALEETIEAIVSRWPQVLYLTQKELSESIKHALEVAGAINFDDQTCDFMAEGILRVAHGSFVDRVNRILRLAGVDVTKEASEDPYLDFAKVVDGFYASLDETNKLEMQVFVDLYEALRQVYTSAQQENNEFVKTETAVHLNELASIIRQDVDASAEVVEAAVEWLAELVETNLETSDWDVSNSVHITTSGDHPKMAEIAKKGYAPASDFSGNWGDSAPVSDGKNYKGGLADEMRSSSWGNIGGADAYPDLSNPYVPKPFGDYKIKGEKHIDADSDHLAHWSSGDTWPNLDNPYVPKSVQVKKMNDGKEKDLIVDK